MVDIDLEKLYSLFERVDDVKLRSQLYSAVGDVSKASELEQKVFLDSLKNKRIETVYDYIAVLNDAALIGISSAELLDSFTAAVTTDLSGYSGLGSEYNPPAVAYLYRAQALFHEARFGVHYYEEDLQKAFELRRQGIEELLRCSQFEFNVECDEILAMLAQGSVTEATKGVYLKSQKSIDAIIGYVACVNRLLKEERVSEDFVSQNVELLLYLNKTVANLPESKQKINQARAEFLDVLTKNAVDNAELVYSKIEKEDTNGFLSWRFKCACAYVQRAIDFADRLSKDEVEKGRVDKCKSVLVENFAKLKEFYEHRKYNHEGFNAWLQQLLIAEDNVPDHKGTGFYVGEDDLMFPMKITLTAKF